MAEQNQLLSKIKNRGEVFDVMDKTASSIMVKLITNRHNNTKGKSRKYSLYEKIMLDLTWHAYGHNPPKEYIVKLAEKTGLTTKRLRTYFSQRRYREKKKKERALLKQENKANAGNDKPQQSGEKIDERNSNIITVE
jgi:hypothetical protein